MAQHGYHLQALLYALALHRHLRQRLADYRFEQHFGGVLYLFVRGVRPGWTLADGTAAGVHAQRPTLQLLDALSALFDAERVRAMTDASMHSDAQQALAEGFASQVARVGAAPGRGRGRRAGGAAGRAGAEPGHRQRPCLPVAWPNCRRCRRGASTPAALRRRAAGQRRGRHAARRRRRGR